MKRFSVVMAILFCIGSAHAQDRGGMEFSFGVNGALPVGNLNVRTRFGIGGDAALGYNFTPHYALLVRGGYVGFIAKDKLPTYNTASVGDGFIKFCGRYTFFNRFYLEPQGGFSAFRGSKARARTVKGNGFTYAGAAGYFLDKGKTFDVSIRYESTISNETVNFVGLRFAYTIGPGKYF